MIHILPTYRVAGGYHAARARSEEVDVSDVERRLKSGSEAYELTNDEGDNRLYFDIDGHASADMQEEDFNGLVASLTASIPAAIAAMGWPMDSWALAVACKFQTQRKGKGESQPVNKLSFRLWSLVYYELKTKIRDFAVQVLLPALQQHCRVPGVLDIVAKQGTGKTTSELIVDTSAYDPNRKMRMLWSRKDGEDRKFHLVAVPGQAPRTVVDTLITYIPAGSQRLPPFEVAPPPDREAPKPRKRSSTAAAHHDPAAKGPKRAKAATAADEVIADDALLEAIQQYIRALDTNLAETTVSDAQFAGGVYMVSVDSHYCGNIDAAHKSNHVYFAVGQEFCTQRCYDVDCAGWSHQTPLAASDEGRVLAEMLYPAGYIATKRAVEQNDGLAFIKEQAVFVVSTAGGDVKFFSRTDVNTRYENAFFATGRHPNSERKEPFIAAWFKDPYRAAYNAVDFCPSLEWNDDGVLNTFAGFHWQRVAADDSVEPLEEDHPTVQDFMWLVRKVAGSDAAAEYLHNYFAHMVQRPTERPGVAVVFSSPHKGIGKDFLGDFIADFIGPKLSFNTHDPQRDIFGNHNSNMTRAFVVKIEEANWSMFHGRSDAFKSLITQERLSINPKGSAPFDVKLYTRFLLTTNHGFVVAIEAGDRRFVIMESEAHERQQQRAWFGPLAAAIRTPAFIKFIAAFWGARDISSFDLIGDRPLTRSYVVAQESSAPLYTRFLRELAVHPAWDVTPLASADISSAFKLVRVVESRALGPRVFISHDELYAAFVEWFRREQGADAVCKVTKNTFDRDIRGCSRLYAEVAPSKDAVKAAAGLAADITTPITSGVVSKPRSARGWLISIAALRLALPVAAAVAVDSEALAASQEEEEALAAPQLASEEALAAMFAHNAAMDDAAAVGGTGRASSAPEFEEDLDALFAKVNGGW